MLPDLIDWIPRDQVIEELKTSKTNLRRDQSTLAELGLIDYESRDTGFSKRDVETLRRFRQLCLQYGRRRPAIKQIYKEFQENG